MQASHQLVRSVLNRYRSVAGRSGGGRRQRRGGEVRLAEEMSLNKSRNINLVHGVRVSDSASNMQAVVYYIIRPAKVGVGG